MAEAELPVAGVRLRGNEEVPLKLACRTVAKAAARLAVDPDSNEAEVQVRCSKSAFGLLEKFPCGKGGGTFHLFVSRVLTQTAVPHMLLPPLKLPLRSF